jgi:murein DD-endopeptidase MepM/ murein hydrolase activator NlpD
MLIPYDRGGTRTLTLSSLHFCFLGVLLTGLTFSTTFLYQRHRAVMRNAEKLRHINRNLELEKARQPKLVQTTGITEDDLRKVENELRAEYEASITAITTELSELYDMEARARSITGLAPRKNNAIETMEEVTGGKGGPPDVSSAISYAASGMIRPPAVIYGMSRPSADLILQEIRLRTRSFSELVSDMEAEIDRIERVPSIWPLRGNTGQITSSYGYRRDPFTGRIRHHNGTDIGARRGTPIRATAKGRVKSSTYDRYMGHMVVVDHGNGMETWYCHLTKRLVKTGEIVAREQQIGTLGSTGRSTGPHLHYEVHVNGKAVDAEKYLTD